MLWFGQAFSTILALASEKICFDKFLDNTEQWGIENKMNDRSKVKYNVAQYGLIKTYFYITASTFPESINHSYICHILIHTMKYTPTYKCIPVFYHPRNEFFLTCVCVRVLLIAFNIRWSWFIQTYSLFYTSFLGPESLSYCF